MGQIDSADLKGIALFIRVTDSVVVIPEHVSLELAIGSRGVIDGSHSQQVQRDVPHVLQSHVASR